MRKTSLLLSLGAVSAVVGALIVSPVSSDVSAANQAAPPLNCDLTQYKASTGLTTALDGSVLTVSWNGQGASQLRARFAIDGGTPTIRDLSVRRGGGGEWAPLKESTIKRRRKGKGTGSPAILRDTGALFASLQPGVSGGLMKSSPLRPSGVKIFLGGAERYSDGTTLEDVATFHHEGKGHLPAREILVQPDAATIKKMGDVAKKIVTAHLNT